MPRAPSAEWATPWDVANAALFLASDEAKYITAVCLLVDGGKLRGAVMRDHEKRISGFRTRSRQTKGLRRRCPQKEVALLRVGRVEGALAVKRICGPRPNTGRQVTIEDANVLAAPLSR